MTTDAASTPLDLDAIETGLLIPQGVTAYRDMIRRLLAEARRLRTKSVSSPAPSYPDLNAIEARLSHDPFSIAGLRWVASQVPGLIAEVRQARANLRDERCAAFVEVAVDLDDVFAEFGVVMPSYSPHHDVLWQQIAQCIREVVAKRSAAVEWVPVSERLPDTDRKVVITVLFPDGRRKMDEAYFDDEWWFRIDVSNSIHVERGGSRVIAWAERTIAPYEGEA